MNRLLLRQRAEELMLVLSKLPPSDKFAESLRHSLAPLIERALDGTVVSPLKVSTIPSNRAFTEGMMDDTPMLAKAYGAFVAAFAGLRD